MKCLDVREQVGCWKHVDGSQENITIVREYGEGPNGIVLVRTHFINAAGEHITLAEGETLAPGDCTVCCGSVLFGNLNETGNTIATITTAEGQSFDIKETITTFTTLYDETTGIKIGEYTSEDGTIVEVFAPKQSIDVNLTPITYVPTATGNTQNLGQVVVDPTGTIWVIDNEGDAQKLTMPTFKEQNRWYVDPNGSNTTGTGANENPYLTIAAAYAQAGQGDTVVVNEGVYAETVTLSTANTTLAGASGAYGSLTQIAGVNATASGTSVRVADLTVTGAMTHTGTSPLYLNNVTVSGAFTASSAVYREIRGSSLQDNPITVTAGTTLIESSKIGTAAFSGTGTVVLLRDVLIDAGECVTIGAGVVYSLVNVTGCVNIDPAAIPAETAALAAGLPAALAEAAVTTSFNNLIINNPDFEAAPTQFVTRDPVTGELEYSNAPVSGATVTVSDEAPTIDGDVEGAIWLVTDDGTPTGTVLEQYIWDSESSTWVEMQRNAQDTLKFGTTSPTGNGEWDGEEFFVTSDGTSAGEVLEQWIWDKQSSTWVLRPTPEIRTTSLTPVVYDGSAYVDAQANVEAGAADLMRLSDGTYIHDGKIEWPGHGYEVGKWYYLSQTTAGAVVTPEPTTGWSQQLFFVEDADTIHVDIEPAEYIDPPVGEDIVSPYFVTATSNANYTLPGSYTPDVNRYNTVVSAESMGGADAHFNTSTYRFTPQRAGWYDVKASYSVYRGGLDTEAAITMRKNGVNIASVGAYGAITSQVDRLVYMNGTTDYIDVVNSGAAAQARAQFAVTSFFQARWLHY